MRKTWKAGLAFGMALVLGSVPAAAQEIAFDGEKCPLTVIYDLQAYKALQNGSLADAAGSDATGVAASDSAAEAAAESTAADLPEAAGQEAAAASDAAASTEGSASEARPVSEEKEVEGMDLLCVVDGDYVAGLLDGECVYFLLDEIAESVPDYDLTELPAASAWEDFGNGNSGDVARAVQEALIGLGYLEGKADGSFGSMSEAALQSFQSAEGLASTGVVDLFTWGLLMEKAVRKPDKIEVPYPPVYTAEEKFASIYDDVEDPALLDEYAGPEWRFSYDDFEGVGIISPKEADLGSWTAESSRAIDRLALELRSILSVQRDESGAVTLTPALEVNSVGAYRPYIKSALLRKENKVKELRLVEEDGWVDGTDVCERAVLALEPEELQELLGADSASGGEELVLRLSGAIQDYDVEIS